MQFQLNNLQKKNIWYEKFINLEDNKKAYFFEKN